MILPEDRSRSSEPDLRELVVTGIGVVRNGTVCTNRNQTAFPSRQSDESEISIIITGKNTSGLKITNRLQTNTSQFGFSFFHPKITPRV